VSIHARDSDRVLANNLRGTELVLGGARKLGVERMIQVSSTAALFRPGAQRIDESSPLGAATTGYGRSKVECDRFVRKLQAGGAPIYTTYPGSVLGPDDPGVSEAIAGLKGFLDGRVVPDTTSGFQLVDARDLGRAHVLLLERGGPPARYLMGGLYFTWSEFAKLLEEVTGERFLQPPTPALAMKLVGRLGDWVSRFLPVELPVSLESTTYATEWAESDDSLIRKEIGLEYRDARETLRDTIRWMQRAGLLWRDYSAV
jgi:nucleoside-diphosphate-sugar epimerase